MKTAHLAAMAAAMSFAGQASAADTVVADKATVHAEPSAASAAPAAMPKPLEPLSAAQLDRVTAGDLGLPNGMVVFEGFDNAAPGDFHPNFDRSPTGFDASHGFGGALGNEGPWSAAFNGSAIEFQCSLCP